MMPSSSAPAMSRTMRPSSRNSVRSAIAAARGSWVTITTVWPTSSTERRSRSRISALAEESRLPVGSSANSTLGRLIMARAIAARCCWPPDSSEGRCVRRSPMRVAAITWSNQARSGSLPAIASGSSMFSSAVSIGSRLKNWKTKPMWSRRSSVSSVSSSLVMSMPSSSTVPSVGRSRPGEQVHQRGLARARRPHHGGELARAGCPRPRRVGHPLRCRPGRSGG